MNLLFLHSGLELTGSVTYARALEGAWQGRHRVFWVNDGVALPGGLSLRLPLRHKGFPSMLASAIRLAGFIRRQRVQLLHAHSRRANQVAAVASRLSGVPYVTTAHLRTRPRLSNRLWPCWGSRTIAICETIAAHLRDANAVPAERIALIRNGIDLDAYRPAATRPSTAPWITLLGRLSGKRWAAALFVLDVMEDLFREFPAARLRLVGGVAPEYRGELERRLDRLNAHAAEPRAVWSGQVDDPRPLIAGSAVVIAAGRSLMEAMAMEVPVIAVGEQASGRLMTPETFTASQRSNFGDFPAAGETGFHPEPVRQDLRQVLGAPDGLPGLRRWSRAQIARDHAVSQVADAIDALYQSVLDERTSGRTGDGRRGTGAGTESGRLAGSCARHSS